MALDADLQLRAARARQERRDTWRGVEQGSVIGLELLVGICLWAGLGWLADGWLGTGPWLLAVGALVGFGGGLYLVWLRTSGRMADVSATGPARDARGPRVDQ